MENLPKWVAWNTENQFPTYLLEKIGDEYWEVYIKDDKGLEGYLLDAGVQDTLLKITDDYVLSGRDLSETLMDARNCIRLLDKAGDHHIKLILEQATLTGVIHNIKKLGDDIDGQKIKISVE